MKAWQSLIALHKQAGQLDLAIEVIKEAIGKVETDKVDNGRFSDIWI